MYDDGSIRLIHGLRCLCRENGVVIWTRRLVKPQTLHSIEVIRTGFEQAGFDELALGETGDDGFVIGTVTYRRSSQPLIPGTSLFEFIGYDQMNKT